jgi:hypothetical protein
MTDRTKIGLPVSILGAHRSGNAIVGSTLQEQVIVSRLQQDEHAETLPFQALNGKIKELQFILLFAQSRLEPK